MIDPYRVIPIAATPGFVWRHLAKVIGDSRDLGEGDAPWRGLHARVAEIRDAVDAQDPRTYGELPSYTNDTTVMLVLRRDQWLFLVELMQGWMPVTAELEASNRTAEGQELIKAYLDDTALIRDAVAESDRQAQAIVDEHADSTVEWML